jgi:diadenosine tetraphosphate (Ap4A) HIT family hydrolase
MFCNVGALMEHLYAPWREEYFINKVEGCVFCHISKHPELDEESRVIYRDDKCFVVMNRYPYTPGHFMVIPHHHEEHLENIDEALFLHISKVVKKGVKVLKESLGAKGVNIGMNLGEEAGAGIAQHMHYHLVPRWYKDTNFITTIGGARVFGSDEERFYLKLKEAWSKTT